MRYKIIVTSPDKSTIEKVFLAIQKSKVYNSTEIVNLHPITEICDECAKRQ